MHNELASAVRDRAKLEELLGRLEADSSAREQISVLWLQDVVEVRGADVVNDALDAAGGAMPVVEASTIATALM
ncbi:MAG: hypothetical protein ACLP0J_24190 [Solirubrobacteraceae bacterium]|jgi:hypothetical protein